MYSEIIFNIEEIDPDKLAKKKGIQKDFQIHVFFLIKLGKIYEILLL